MKSYKFKQREYMKKYAFYIIGGLILGSFSFCALMSAYGAFQSGRASDITSGILNGLLLTINLLGVQTMIKDLRKGSF